MKNTTYKCLISISGFLFEELFGTKKISTKAVSQIEVNAVRTI